MNRSESAVVKNAGISLYQICSGLSIPGPEMKSTGEVMGIAKRFRQAYAKAQLGAGAHIVKRRRAFVSVRDAGKGRVGEIAKRLIALGFEIVATRGTALLFLGSSGRY